MTYDEMVIWESDEHIEAVNGPNLGSYDQCLSILKHRHATESYCGL